MTRREFEAILVRRSDVHPNMVDVHLRYMDAYCLAEDPHFVLEGVRCHLVCGEGRGHAGKHEDVEGGIWWDERSTR